MISGSSLPWPAVAFVVVVAVVLGLGAISLVRMVLERAGKATPPTRPQRIARASVLACCGAGVACIVYGFTIEPNWLVVTHTRVESARWPASAPLRIALLSDLHCESRPRLEERIPAIVAAEHPDLVVFTGDALNDRAAAPVFRAVVTELATIAPVYAVRGNWDVWYWNDVDLFGNTGAHELEASGDTIEVHGARVFVGGAAVGREHLVASILASAPRDAFRLFLHHYPDAIEAAAQSGADLYLAGHTHGGQIALPLYGALVTFSRYGKRFEAGRYRVAGTDMYVTRGIGMEGGAMPRARFGARPEIAIIDVAADRH